MVEQISIVMADDHPIVRMGLRMSLQTSREFVVLGEAGDGQTALEMICKHRPQIILLDVDMPKLDGFEVAREIRRRDLGTRIIFLTLHTNEEIFQTAIEVGGKGYVLKDSATREIVASIRAVANGQMYVSPAMTAFLLSRRDAETEDSDTGDLKSLTAGERRIIKLISQGKTSKEIGDELSIHYRTIENYRTNICRKLGLEGANALLRFAVQRAGKLR